MAFQEITNRNMVQRNPLDLEAETNAISKKRVETKNTGKDTCPWGGDVSPSEPRKQPVEDDCPWGRDEVSAEEVFEKKYETRPDQTSNSEAAGCKIQRHPSQNPLNTDPVPQDSTDSASQKKVEDTCPWGEGNGYGKHERFQQKKDKWAREPAREQIGQNAADVYQLAKNRNKGSFSFTD